MTKQSRIILIISIIILSFQGSVYAEEDLGIYEKLDEYIPSDLVFVTENYDTVKLMSIIDKPTVLVPVYYECP